MKEYVWSIPVRGWIENNGLNMFEKGNNEEERSLFLVPQEKQHVVVYLERGPTRSFRSVWLVYTHLGTLLLVASYK